MWAVEGTVESHSWPGGLCGADAARTSIPDVLKMNDRQFRLGRRETELEWWQSLLPAQQEDWGQPAFPIGRESLNWPKRAFQPFLIGLQECELVFGLGGLWKLKLMDPEAAVRLQGCVSTILLPSWARSAQEMGLSSPPHLLTFPCMRKSTSGERCRGESVRDGVWGGPQKGPGGEGHCCCCGRDRRSWEELSACLRICLQEGHVEMGNWEVSRFSFWKRSTSEKDARYSFSLCLVREVGEMETRWLFLKMILA